MASSTQVAPQVQAGEWVPRRRKKGGGRLEQTHSSSTGGVRADSIEGRFRLISTQSLCLAWWLYSEGHITKRQIRIFFAAQEMLDRRTFSDASDSPIFRLSELLRLIGGQDSPKSQRAVRGDLRALRKIGLVSVSAHKITFAQSPEQIAVENLSPFWEMWSLIPNKRRRVPVPRRTLRALAGGFSKSVTGVVLAMLIRSVYVHRETGDLRIDGRTKRQWIEDVFGISKRRVSEARAHLTELGWLKPLDTTQWQLNRWGAHDQINVDWKPGIERADDGAGEEEVVNPSTVSVDETVDRPVDHSAAEVSGDTKPAPPNPQNAPKSASLCTNRTPFPSGKEIETRTLFGGTPPNPSGFSNSKLGSEKKEKKLRTRRGGRRRERDPNSPPVLHDVRAKDLRCTDALLELHRQAINAGIASNSPGGRLDFLSFAERARSRGEKPEALFMWLVKGNRRAFITLADEDAAAARLREHLNGPDTRKRIRRDGISGVAKEIIGGGGSSPPPVELSEEERFVQACIQVAKQHRGLEPFQIAQKAKGWSRERWETEFLTYQTNQTQRQVQSPE